MNKPSNNYCLNCEEPIGTEKFCSFCGQKNAIQNFSIRYLFVQFLEAFFNFDKKLFRSLRDIWIPNKITNSFLAGNRSTYVNPIRFFFICLVIFFGLVALESRNDNDSENIKTQTLEVLLRDFQKERMLLDPNKKNPALDSIEQLIIGSKPNTESNAEAQLINIELGGMDEVQYDAHKLSRDSLHSKYNINSWYDKIIYDKKVKFNQQNTAFLKLFENNMLWGIVLLSLLVALILKLIFIRYNSFFFEHLMQIINFHSITMIGMAIILILDIAFLKSEAIIGGLHIAWFILCFLNLTVSLKRYYHQGWFMIGIKSSILFFLYIISIILVLAAIVGLSFLLI